MKGRLGFADWEKEIVAGVVRVAKRKTIGRSPWLWASSDATNQKTESNCEIDLKVNNTKTVSREELSFSKVLVRLKVYKKLKKISCKKY